MSLLDSLIDKVENAWNDVTETGVPALIAGAAQYGSEQLSQLAKEQQKQATNAMNQAVQSGQPSTGLFASIQSVFGNVAVDTGLKQYGVYILIGAAVIYIAAKKGL